MGNSWIHEEPYAGPVEPLRDAPRALPLDLPHWPIDLPHEAPGGRRCLRTMLRKGWIRDAMMHLLLRALMTRRDVLVPRADIRATGNSLGPSRGASIGNRQITDLVNGANQ